MTGIHQPCMDDNGSRRRRRHSHVGQPRASAWLRRSTCRSLVTTLVIVCCSCYLWLLSSSWHATTTSLDHRPQQQQDTSDAIAHPNHVARPSPRPMKMTLPPRNSSFHTAGFVHIGKTGGSTLSSWLQNGCNSLLVACQHNITRPSPVSQWVVRSKNCSTARTRRLVQQLKLPRSYAYNLPPFLLSNFFHGTNNRSTITTFPIFGDYPSRITRASSSRFEIPTIGPSRPCSIIIRKTPNIISWNKPHDNVSLVQ
jgi:hypothetical protein